MPLHHPKFRYDYQRVRQIVGDLNAFMERYGYEIVDLPIIEAADLFLTKAGDQIIQKLFTFERQGQELALRPEFTAPAAYYYVTSHASEPVVRWQFSGPVFEDDPHQLERTYQYCSVGAELLGMAGPHAEAEIIAMAASGTSLLGISDWQLLIGHAGLTRHLLARFDLDTRTQRFLLSQLSAIKERGKVHVLEQLDSAHMMSTPRSLVSGDSSSERDTQPAVHVLFGSAGDQKAAMGDRSREDIARRLLQKRQEALKRSEIEAALDFLEQWVNVTASPADAFASIEQLILGDETAWHMLDKWRAVIDLLVIYEVPPARITILPALARSWEYYSGVVFELRTSADLHLGGGGRYDELPRLIGGRHEVPAVGFAYYVDQMLGVIPAYAPLSNDVLYIALDDDNDSAAARWAQRLRSHGITVALCPRDKLDRGQRRLLVNPDSSARFDEQSFLLSESESLAVKLNENKHDQ